MRRPDAEPGRPLEVTDDENEEKRKKKTEDERTGNVTINMLGVKPDMANLIIFVIL